MGFSIPLAKWFRKDLKEVFEGKVLTEKAFSKTFFNLDPVRGWWAQHQRGTRDYSYHFWMLLVLEFWGRRFFGENK
jgi:asparagine synthase (glutamine-hydrolysing)